MGLITADRERGMKWRVIVELTGGDGTVREREVSAGGGTTIEHSPGLQYRLVRAHAEDQCRERRRCSRCGPPRPARDARIRRLLLLFGTVEVRAPGFAPCRCALICSRALSPVTELTPDRCTPEYERSLQRWGLGCPTVAARTLLSEFLPFADIPAVETTHQPTMHVGAGLEREAAIQPPTPATEAGSIALSIDGGHVRSVRSYQVRSFEIFVAQVSNDDGKHIVFIGMSAGADGPRSLGEAASLGRTHHVLDWFRHAA